MNHRRRASLRSLPTLLLASASLLAGCVETHDDPTTSTLKPRTPLPRAPIGAAPTGPARVVVKFRDEVQARARAGQVSLAEGETGTHALAARQRLRFTPLIPLADAELDRLAQDAATASGTAQPDLAGFMIVDGPGVTVAGLDRIVEELQRLPEVELAWIERLQVPPPGDIAPATADLVPLQTYRGSATGVDIDGAWALGARGAGVRLSDVEYGWNPAHEDLMDRDLHPEPGQTPAPDVATNGWDEHGTAVAGITSGVVNGYGVSGLAPDADLYTYPEWTVEGGFRRSAAIAAAVTASQPGDVVMLEMQAYGVDNELVPAEYDPAVWTIVKSATDKGVIVVAAAGNGNADLDSAAYDEYRARGDSGAIIVGGGTADAVHGRYLGSYGTRVNLQGWATDVATTGYGGLGPSIDDKHQRYGYFNGTSAATPIVASAVLAVQSVAVARVGQRLTPAEMRELLVRTGTAQGGTTPGHIGPLPDVAAAVTALGANLPTNQPPTVAITAPAADAAVAGLVNVTATAADADGTVARVVFTLPGGLTVEDTSAPYQASWDSRAVANGAHVVEVRAYDNGGASTAVARSVTVANVCPGGSFVATGLPVAIPDGRTLGVTSTINVSGAGTIASLRLSLRVKHPYKGDLRITLIAPDGTAHVVHNRTGGSADDVVLTDLGLKVFDGRRSTGGWRLKVQDLAARDAGSLQAWSLAITGVCGS